MRPGRNEGTRRVTDDDDRRAAFALKLWRKAGPSAGSPVETYLRSRGISVSVPPTLRFAPALKYTPADITLPAMLGAVQGRDARITAVHRVYLDPRGDRKAQVSNPKMTLGPLRDGAVRLAPAGEILALTEGIEDGLALMQMTEQPAWAVLGTSGFSTFAPPAGVKTIVLAPDADAAGDGAVPEAASRFADMGLRVLRLRPPDGRDWSDALDEFEERAAIRQYDGGAVQPNAELWAFAEVLSVELNHAN